MTSLPRNFFLALMRAILPISRPLSARIPNGTGNPKPRTKSFIEDVTGIVFLWWRTKERECMPPKRSQKESVTPTLTPAQAIPLLQRQRGRADVVAKAHFDDPQVDAWVNSTENILNQAFGKPDGEWHANTRAFMYADGLQMCVNAPDAHIQQSHHVRTARRMALLEGFVEQLQDLAPPSATTALDQYKFHSEIERVSGELYRSGHYKSAALEAYIRVIGKVGIV